MEGRRCTRRLPVELNESNLLCGVKLAADNGGHRDFASVAGTIASSRPQRVAMTLLTLLALAGGLLIAAPGGDLAMRGNASMPHDAGGMEMRM